MLLSHLASRWGFPALHLVQAKIQKGHDTLLTRKDTIVTLPVQIPG